jgi:hypothetical protein
MRKRAQIRASIKSRYWHVVLCALAAALIFGIADFVYFKGEGALPRLKDIWLLVITVPLLCGMWVTLGCGGAALWKRIVTAAICGIAVGALYAILSAILSSTYGITAYNPITTGMWRMFAFALLSAIGVIVTELKLPEPE